MNPFLAKNVCSTTNDLLGPPITYLLARYDLINEQYPFEGFPEMVLSLLDVDCNPAVLASSPTVITAFSSKKLVYDVINCLLESLRRHHEMHPQQLAVTQDTNNNDNNTLTASSSSSSSSILSTYRGGLGALGSGYYRGTVNAESFAQEGSRALLIVDALLAANPGAVEYQPNSMWNNSSNNNNGSTSPRSPLHSTTSSSTR